MLLISFRSGVQIPQFVLEELPGQVSFTQTFTCSGFSNHLSSVMLLVILPADGGSFMPLEMLNNT